MTTVPTAQAALIHVAQTQFAANVNDPTWGALYQLTRFVNYFPIDTKAGGALVAVYRIGGMAYPKGLGFTEQYRNPHFRVDCFGRTLDEADQCIEAVRGFWIADMLGGTSLTVPTGAVGSGYLRATGGIKFLEMGEARAAPWEKTGVMYRRIADVTVEIMGG